MNQSSKSIWHRTALAMVLAAGAGTAMAIDVGQRAPDFDLPGLQNPVRLADYRGKTVYLDFWASWCGPCRQSFPWMNDIQARYQARGLRVVGINLDQKPDDARRFLADVPARFDLAFDPAGNAPRAFAIKGMPTSVLIGPDGKVLAVHSGFRDEQRAELERLIQQALSPGKAP